ncbi:MAG: hypothetical protein IJD88_01175 [Clostridia bacterium]|nr:hypothetical protein [Clostridia bacterium]
MIVLYIILGILILLALVISTALILPLKLIITYSDEKGFDIKFKILWHSFEKKDDSDIFDKIFNKFTKKKAPDTSKVPKKSVQKKGLNFTVKEIFELVKSVLQGIVPFFKSFVVSKLELDIICADSEDVSDAATDYGKVCAIVYPVLGFIHSNFKVKKRKERINISCDYLAEKPSVTFDAILSVRVVHVISAFMPTIKTAVKQIFKKSEFNRKKRMSPSE